MADGYLVGGPAATTHTVYRVSPKGGPFVGTCSLCGRAGLTLRDAMQPCENIRGLTQEQALLEALDADA